MSETKTIEERYEKIAQRLRETSSNSQGFFFAIAIKSLLDDLMAERGKKVNLDEIFPKEVMEKAVLYHITSLVNTGVSCNTANLKDGLDRMYLHCDKGLFEIVAQRKTLKRGDLKELARVRVRLGLTVEIVESK